MAAAVQPAILADALEESRSLADFLKKKDRKWNYKGAAPETWHVLNALKRLTIN